MKSISPPSILSLYFLLFVHSVRWHMTAKVKSPLLLPVILCPCIIFHGCVWMLHNYTFSQRVLDVWLLLRMMNTALNSRPQLLDWERGWWWGVEGCGGGFHNIVYEQSVSQFLKLPVSTQVHMSHCHTKVKKDFQSNLGYAKKHCTFNSSLIKAPCWSPGCDM